MNVPVTWDHSIRQFMEQAGSPAPTPGGGSAAALVAALGTAMTAMVANLTQGERYAQVRERMMAVAGEMQALSALCEHLLAADIESFERYMASSRLPKITEEEKGHRSAAMRQAVAAAIEVPLRLMEACRDGLFSTASIARSCNKNVISDLGIAALLFEAAAQSALLTVEMNMATLRDSALKNDYTGRSAALIGEIAELKNELLDVVHSRMA